MIGITELRQDIRAKERTTRIMRQIQHACQLERVIAILGNTSDRMHQRQPPRQPIALLSSVRACRAAQIGKIVSKVGNIAEVNGVTLEIVFLGGRDCSGSILDIKKSRISKYASLLGKMVKQIRRYSTTSIVRSPFSVCSTDEPVFTASSKAGASYQ